MQLVKKFTASCGTRSSLPCPQEPTTDQYPYPDEFSLLPSIGAPETADGF